MQPTPYKEMTDQFWKTYREVVQPKTNRVIVRSLSLVKACRPCPCEGTPCLCTNAERGNV